MSGVQNSIICPQCGQPESFFTEYETRSGEEWGLCDKCGFKRRRIALRDRKKETKIRKLVEGGKIIEALNLAECNCTVDLKDIEFLKLTKDNYRIYRHYQKKGYGVGRIESKEEGIGQFGPLQKDKEKRQKQIQKLLGLRDKCNVKITEVLDDGTIKEY